MNPWNLIDTPKLGPKVSGDELADREYYTLTIGVERKKGEQNPARCWVIDGNPLPCYAQVTARVNP